MDDSTVVLARCADYESARVSAAIARVFELLGGLGRFVKRGDTVLVKPNLIAPRSREHAAQTDPVMIVETARLLKDFGARPFVGDSPAWGDVRVCSKVLGLDEALGRLGVPLRQLDGTRWRRVGTRGTRVGMSAAALEADVIINLPKFKAHQQVTATFAVKNMFGCVTGKQKALWHFLRGKRESDFCELLVDIYRFLAPAVTIVDGVIAMDGPGPIKGRARPLGWVVGGVDPIACEVVCGRLVNIEAEELPMVRAARRMGFGTWEIEKIRIVGDEFPREVCMDFEIPVQIPVRFSLARVLKSMCKQIMLFAKAAGRPDSRGK